jgi:hypothetical protein
MKCVRKRINPDYNIWAPESNPKYSWSYLLRPEAIHLSSISWICLNWSFWMKENWHYICQYNRHNYKLHDSDSFSTSVKTNPIKFVNIQYILLCQGIQSGPKTLFDCSHAALFQCTAKNLLRKHCTHTSVLVKQIVTNAKSNQWTDFKSLDIRLLHLNVDIC